MSSSRVTIWTLQIQFQAERRSIENTLREVIQLLTNPKESDYQRLDLDLAEVACKLKSFYDTAVEIAELIDSEGKTDEQLKEEKDKQFIDYDRLYTTFCEHKGKYLALVSAHQEKKAKRERSKEREK